VGFIIALFFQLAILTGNIFKFTFYSPDVRISLLDIVVFMVTSGIVLVRLKDFSKLLSENIQITSSLFILICWLLITLFPTVGIYGTTATVIGLFYWIRLLLYSLLGFALASLFTRGQIKNLTFVSGLSLLISGIFQYLVFPDIRNLQVSEWDPHYYRVVGSLLDPGFMAILLLLFMVFLITRPLKNLFHNYLLISTTYLIFALTYSRSGYLAMMAYSAVVSFTKHSWRPLILSGLLLFFTVLILPRSPDGEGVKLERTSSITARIQNWKNSFHIILSHPISGVGYNVYRYAQKEAGFLDNSNWLKSHAGAGADSSLLFITATSGLFGLLFYLNYLKALFSLKTISYELTALLIHSMFLNSLFYPLVLFWISCLVAISIARK